MLEIVCALRYHSDATVRRSLLYALSRVLLIDIKGKSSSNPYLGRSCVFEIKNWLDTMSKEDSDSICREQSGVLLNSGWFS